MLEEEVEFVNLAVEKTKQLFGSDNIVRSQEGLVASPSSIGPTAATAKRFLPSWSANSGVPLGCHVSSINCRPNLRELVSCCGNTVPKLADALGKGNLSTFLLK